MKNIAISRLLIILIVTLTVSVSSCKKFPHKDEENKGPDVNAYILTDDDKLALVNARTGVTSTPVSITGLQAKEHLLAIDFRPATGQLYALGSSSRIYTLNPVTGESRAIGNGPFTPLLPGNKVGFDFNPTVDRIRIVTSEGQNLRVNPETGAVVFIDGNIVNTSAISAVAYTNNTAGAATTILYDIDTKTNKLYKQDPPNAGTLVEVGNLDVDMQEIGGFDISPDGTAALAASANTSGSSLYSIDLNTGMATRILKLNGKITGLAIPTNPVAYAIGANNEFITFNPSSGTIVNKALSGLQAGETVLGLDMRPANGQLYLLGSTSRIYTINASSGAASAVGAGVFATALSGTNFGFDFNPVVDRIRIISNNGQNLRVHPETGAVAFVDGMLKPGAPAVTAAAYNNNFAGSTSTTLFDIDSETNLLYKQDPPNDGMLTPVGPLNIDITASNGFDIGGTSAIAYAIISTTTGTKLYKVNLMTGAASAVRDFPVSVRAFTIGLGF